jgi:hypothetical protein
MGVLIMAIIYKWGKHPFEVLTMNDARQIVKAGVFIFASEDSKFISVRWTAYFIGETNNFRSLSRNLLWDKAQKMGANHVHILTMDNESERKTLIKDFIKIYNPVINLESENQAKQLFEKLTQAKPLVINQSEQSTQPETKEKTMSDYPDTNATSRRQYDAIPKEKETMPNDTEITGQLGETKAKLELLYQYEKHYLELIKEYKEEIKFANSLQEDLRRERSQFFTQTLKEVIQTMKTAEVDKTVSAQWIQELVASYTKSIDLSGDLAKTHVIEILSLLTSDTKREAAEAQLDSISTKTDAK